MSDSLVHVSGPYGNLTVEGLSVDEVLDRVELASDTEFVRFERTWTMHDGELIVGPGAIRAGHIACVYHANRDAWMAYNREYWKRKTAQEAA